MSGGSYNWLCFKDTEDLFNALGDLKEMANGLQKHAPDAAKETEDLIAYIEHADRQVTARAERLHKVWKAIEWWQSGDTCKKQFDQALEDYRNE